MSLLLLVQLFSAHASPVAGGVEEIWVQAETPAERTTLAALPLGFAEGYNQGWWRIHAEAEGIEALRRSGLSWRHAEQRLMPADAYHSPDEMVAALEALAVARPDRAHLVDLGWSLDGRPIVGVRITDSLAPQAQWRIAAAHHGDETVSAEVALALAQALTTGADPGIEAMLQTEAVWVIPHVNPDGVAALSRYNGNNVDLNRNYGYEWSPSEFRPGPEPFSEPETRALRSLSAWEPFGAGLSLHAGATNLGWVWNYTTHPAPDAAIAEDLAESYEESCTQGGFYITNGAEWYITHGDTTDWAYGRHGTLDYTLEVSTDKNPSEAGMASVIGHHTPAVLNLLQWPWQYRGQVVNKVTGRGIPGVITSDGGGWPVHTGPLGRFSRPAGFSATTLEFSAPGYVSQTLTVDPTTEEVIRVELVSVGILDVRPEPARLSRSGPGLFHLDIETDRVTLFRPGEDKVEATRSSEGWSVDLTALSPGPWGLLTDAGVIERSLFVGELSTDVRIHHAAQDGPTRWIINGEGFGRGTQVWGIWGSERAYTPIPVISQDDTTIVIEHDELATAPPPIDLLMLSNGHQLALVDLGVEEPTDTGVPRDDTGLLPGDDTAASGDSTATDPLDGDEDRELGGSGKLTTCACATARGYPGGWVLVSLTLWFNRRRPA